MAHTEIKRIGAKIFIGLGSALVLYAVLLFKFSSVESRYECTGTISDKNIEQAQTLYVKLEMRRRWIAPWANTDGYMWIEVPRETTKFIPYIQKESEDMLILYDNDPKQGSGFDNFSGTFITLGNSLRVWFKHIGEYNGTCRKMDDG